MKPKLFFLIGPPAVGKSTWIERNGLEHNAIISRDELVKKVAREENIGTYDDMFTPVSEEITPPGMPSKEQILGPDGSELLDKYVRILQRAADRFNARPENHASVARFGSLVPFAPSYLKFLIVDLEKPLKTITPFSYEKVKLGNERVSNMFNDVRTTAAKSRGDVILDMVNMSIQERNLHRKFFVSALKGININQANPNDINEFYEQIAVLFEPPGGFTDSFKLLIKKVADDRNETAKLQGDSKTIPQRVYDDWFAMYAGPTLEEGFSQIIEAGVPSLSMQPAQAAGLKERILRKFIRTLV